MSLRILNSTIFSVPLAMLSREGGKPKINLTPQPPLRNHGEWESSHRVSAILRNLSPHIE